MKKEWVAPTMESLNLGETAYDTLDGSNVDGTWLESSTCTYKDAYYLS